MTLDEKKTDVIINILIGSELNNLAGVAMTVGNPKGFENFRETIRSVVRGEFEKRWDAQDKDQDKLDMISGLLSGLRQLCDSFRVGSTLGVMNASGIIKPDLKIVKKINKIH